MSHHVSGAVECPLASLGHNPPSLDQSYHHPLSTSPLDPQAYQMLRKSQESPILNLDAQAICSPAETKRTNIRATDSNTFPPQRNNASTPSYDSSALLSRRDLQRLRNQTYTPVDPVVRMIQPVPLQRGRSTFALDTTNEPPDMTDVERYFLSDKMASLIIDSAIRNGKIIKNGNNNNNHSNHSSNHNNSGNSNHNSASDTDRIDYLDQDNSDGCYNYYNVTNAQVNGYSPKLRRRPSSPDTSGSDRYFLDRLRGSPAFVSRNAKLTSIKSPADASRFQSSGQTATATTTTTLTTQTFLDSPQLGSGRFSPSQDQGYHTLNTPSPPSGQQLSLWNNNNVIKKVTPKRGEGFHRLPNHLVIRIFEWLDSSDLCNLTQVCKRFETLVWNPVLWKNIAIKGE